ncbi:LysR substrate-binding domain-containing protein [Bradyrhizobium cenepequi]|uniref:LysR substrate-binding domain-containing protein n=1 Tax=Bradyrhizobium cenepequi TaxID=2821403 RepID=UPI001CE381B6|nr:LysR substrate-binding domain-containing protein [Bradyrhizobium cenepequi]MCA6113097.1 LysR family transcriptional regulator [Bradyrhizobium cenepequi]
MAMDLRRLRYFITVAEEGHITRAAERLDMQQPPLSRQISLMERELNVQLFRRLSRGVELTSAGQALFREARATLAHLDRALETTRRAARGEQGILCVGIAPTAPFNPLVPKAIRSFRETFPLVSLVLEEGLSHEVVVRFNNDQMDVAFVRAPQIHADGVVVMPLQEEPMVAALPSRHPMARSGRSKAVPLKSLASDRFILIGPPGTGLHDETVAACRAAGFVPRLGQPAPRITSTLGLVAAGLGIALVPSTMQSVRMDGVIYRRLQGVAPKAFLGLASRRADPSPVLRQFLSLVRTIAKRDPPSWS